MSTADKEWAKGGCDICGKPAYVNVTMSLVGCAGLYCLKHANKYSGLTFIPWPWYKRLWRRLGGVPDDLTSDLKLNRVRG